MRLLLKLTIMIGVLGAVGTSAYFAYPHAMKYWKERNAPQFRLAKVSKGEIVWTVNATGTVQPVLRVPIGSFVSGPIEKLNVDFNDRVYGVDRKEYDADSENEIPDKYVLAEIDPRIHEAAKARDEAALETAEAEEQRVIYNLEKAQLDYDRALALQKEDEKYISQTEIDQYYYNKVGLDAQLLVARAAIKRAKANLDNSNTNLQYTKIVSPVDGIVIDRRIDEGQTLAAQFQTPELFVVAPRMEEEMYVYAAVDEADIGAIAKAHESQQPVFFTVDAYTDDLFEGKIHQIRRNSASTQGVVTYPVVVITDNPGMKLFPGMTANISFQIEKREEIVKIPNSAIRFYPTDKQLVREEDHKLLEGEEEGEEEKEEEETSDLRSATQRILAREKRDRRHVWIKEGEFLKAIEVTIGLSDYKYTEMLSGDLEEGQELVTGVK